MTDKDHALTRRRLLKKAAAVGGAAIAAVPYSNSVKIGLQMARRFWETDDYIYGGHSFTSQDIAARKLSCADSSRSSHASCPWPCSSAAAGSANARK